MTLPSFYVSNSLCFISLVDFYFGGDRLFEDIVFEVKIKINIIN